MSTDAEKIQTLNDEIQNQKEYIEMLEEETESLKQEIDKLKKTNSVKQPLTNDNDNNKQIEQLTIEIETLKAKIQELNDEIEFTKVESQEEIEKLQQQFQQDQLNYTQLHQQEITKLNKQIEEYRIQIVNLQEQVNDDSQNIIQDQSQNDEINQLKSDLEELRNQIESLQNENELLKLQDLELKAKNEDQQDLGDKEFQPNEEVIQLQNQINDLQQILDETQKQVQNFQKENVTLKTQISQLIKKNEQQQLDLDQKVLEIKDEQSKVEQLENDLIKFEEQYQEVIITKEQLSEENQSNSEKLREFDKLQSDNAELQIILNEKIEELNQIKLTNPFEKMYLDLQEDYDNFKQYAQEQFNIKEYTITSQIEQLQDYELCKESLGLLDEQQRLLTDQLNKQIEKNQNLEDQIQENQELLNLMNQKNLQFEDAIQQNEHLKTQIEALKQENYHQQQKILDLENQIQIQKQMECDSPIKLQKLQQEYFQNQDEFSKFKDQTNKEIHLIKQELSAFKIMIDSYISLDNNFESQIQIVQEYYEKLVSFSESIVQELLTLKDQQQSIQSQLKFQDTQEIQTEIISEDKETYTDILEQQDVQIQTEQQQVEQQSLSGSMWLNNETINSNQDQFQQMKKKNEDLDQLLKNYEKEVSNLKQHNKALQKKIDINTKPNTQDRLGKRTSLFEQIPRKSKQFHFNNLCESQQIDDQQRETVFLKDLVETLKKEKSQLYTENQENQEKLKETKDQLEKYQEEQGRLEEQLQSQILLNQTRNRSVDNNQTNVSQFQASFIQLNQIELFLVVKSAKNFQFPYIEFNRKQIKFFSQGKTRIEKQIYETFTFDEIFLDFSKVSQYFTFYGKISLDQSRMFLIIGSPKTQKKFLFIMILDLYANLIREQKTKQNLKFNISIQYSEKIGNNWNVLEQLSSNFVIQSDSLEENLQQLCLAIQNLKFYLYGKNYQAKYLGKEKFRKIEINYTTIFRDQKYQQQFIIMTIPIIQRCEFPKFLKKFCNHNTSLNFKYYCLLTINPILLHYNPTVDIIYFAKMVYAQNNQEELNKQMKIDDESVKQVRQATGQVILKNQEIDVLKKQLESLKKQYHDILQKSENKQQLNQQLIAVLQNVVVDIKLKMSQQKSFNKSPNKQNSETQFYEKIISQLENLSRKLTPIQQNLLTERSYSP